MKLLERWQIREALEYAGGLRDEQSMERMSRALNYFNLSNNNLRCRWSRGTNGSGEYESELETECLRPAREKSQNPLIPLLKLAAILGRNCLFRTQSGTGTVRI
jgi:hypothetical protein